MNTLATFFNLFRWILREGKPSRMIIFLLTIAIVLFSPLATGALTSVESQQLYPASLSSLDSLTSTNFEFISEYQIPGGHPPNGIVISEPYAYIAYGDARFEGWGLRILDLSDPAKPFLVGAYDIPHEPGNSGQVLNLRLVDFYVYLAAGEDGLRIIDVSTPSSPFEVSFYKPPPNGYVWDVEISNNTAYVATGDAGLRLVDISDPAKPEELDFVDIEPAKIVKVNNDHIFVAQEIDLWILDQLSLAPIGSFSLGSDNTLMRLITELEIHQSQIYISWGNCFRVCSGGLWILDITDPSSPMTIGSYEDYTIFRSFTSIGNLIFAVTTSISYPYTNLVQCLDITNPSAISLIDQYPSVGETLDWLYGIESMHMLLYVTMNEGKLITLRYKYFPYPLYLPVITNLE
jgi:hypothetical protein